MAPITDVDVSDLKRLVARLENRVHELEAKAGISAPKSASERMRMVLMGPPGAGKLDSKRSLSLILINWRRQRYTGSCYQGQILYMSFGSFCFHVLWGRVMLTIGIVGYRRHVTCTSDQENRART